MPKPAQKKKGVERLLDMRKFLGQRVDDIKVSSNNQRNRKKSIRRPPPGKLKIDSGNNYNSEANDNNFGFQKQFYSDE